jgi:hypothetical protein
MSIISIGIPIPDRSALPGQSGSGEEVNLQYATQNYCANSSNASPTVATPAGGTFSYAPGGISGGANGTIVIANSIPGNYIVTYTVAGVGSANFPINISALDDASFSYSASAFCADASNQTPTIATPGGTFTTQDITFRPFQMQFEVASGVEKTIEIYASSTGNFTIDWGDNSTVLSNYTTGTISHTYNTGNVGTTVDPIISIGAQNDDPVNGAKHTTNSASDLIDTLQWGDMEFSKYQFQDRFQGCNNSRFQISATDAPNIETPVWNMRRLFYYATHFNSDISHWNADAGATFSQAFQGSNFNQPLNSWDVSRVTSFSSTFQGTPFNQDLSGWDTSSATSFYSMFQSASSFNQNLSDWDISSLTTAVNMFRSNTNLSVANYTDTVVGWAVFVYNNSGSPSSVPWTATTPSFDGTRTSDLASGQTYVAKYGANWPSSWTNNNAQDAYDYLTTTLSWTIN